MDQPVFAGGGPEGEPLDLGLLELNGKVPWQSLWLLPSGCEHSNGLV